MNQTYFFNRVILLLVVTTILFLFPDCKRKDQNAERQTGPKIIGIMTFVSHEVLDSIEQGLIERLMEFGYGKDNIRVINANGEMDKVHAFAKEMVSANYDILVPISTPVSQAIIKAAKGNIPIVYSFVSDPGAIGVDPETKKAPENVTGLSDIVNYDGNLRLIRKIMPNAYRIGIIYNPSESNSVMGIEECRKIAPQLSLQIEEVTVASTSEILNAARLIVGKVDAFYIIGDNTVVSGATAIIKVAMEKKIPVFASDMGSVKGGALAAFSVDYKGFGKRTAEIVNLVLKGEKPNNIPPKFYLGDYLVINKKAFSILKLKLPKELENRVKEEF